MTVAAARPSAVRSLVFPVVLDGVDAKTMTSLFVFVSTGRLSPLHLILLLAWVRNDTMIHGCQSLLHYPAEVRQCAGRTAKDTTTVACYSVNLFVVLS